MTPFVTFFSRPNRFVRFLLAGGINTLFGFAVYGIAIVTGVPVWGALLIANVAGIAFNFATTGSYVFRDLVMARLPRFISAYVIVYLINLKLIEWLSHLVTGSIRAQAILTIPMAIFSYFLMKNFVFFVSNTGESSSNGGRISQTANLDVPKDRHDPRN